jgi:uncharacterized coiled-coil DUF342 family protein
MATEEEKDNKIFDEFSVLRTDLSEIKKELTSLNDEKEHWFSEKEKLGSTIRDKIKSVKEAKQKRDKLTLSVKENKVKRVALEKIIQDLSDKLSKLKDEREKVYTKHNLNGIPQDLKKKIAILQTKVEVEVMSFDKETKIMKEIRELKTKFKEFSVAEEINKEIRNIQKDFSDKKKESNGLAKLVREEAGKSQAEHNQMISLSKEIDELKAKEEECFKKFSGLKEKFTLLNTNYKSKLSEIDSVKGDLKEKKEQKRKENVKKQQETLNEMRGKVDEKLKKGMKLTTEDLKIFQNSED